MRNLIFCALFLLASESARAQSVIAGAHFNGGIPVKNFKTESASLFIPTLSGIILYDFQTSPIEIGFELGYGIYGSNLENRTDLFPGGRTDKVRLRRNNNLLTGMGVVRYSPFKKHKVSPFFEAQMGMNYLYTKYKIRKSIISDTPIEVDKDLEDWTLGNRIGTGLQFSLTKNEKLRLELRINYQDTNSIHYLQRGDVEYDPNEGAFNLNTRRSPLQSLIFSVGIIGSSNGED